MDERERNDTEIETVSYLLITRCLEEERNTLVQGMKNCIMGWRGEESLGTRNSGLGKGQPGM